MQSELRAGCATADITPDVGIHMGGYWGRTSGATDIGDPLMAKVLFCDSGERRVALVALDLVALEAETVERMRQRIEREVGIESGAVMVCCSHTHAGPLTCDFRGMGDVDRAYLGRVEQAVVELVGQAAHELEPARLAHATVPVQIGINRRQGRPGRIEIGQNPDGPVAPYAHVVRLEVAGELQATLFSHACHPVVLGNDNHSISGDFAGAAARYIEAHTQRPALFVNGACGDINPRITAGDFADVEALGEELGRAVVEGLGEAEELDASALGYRVARLQLPLIDPPPRAQMEMEKAILQLKAEIKKIVQGGGDIWAQRIPQAHLDWARDMLALARAGVRDQRQSFEIQALCLGDLVLLGLEGEIFVRYQLDLEQAADRRLVLCGFANGCIGYVPTADEYPRGGYEVDSAYKVYRSTQMIAPQSEALIRQSAASLLEELGP